MNINKVGGGFKSSKDEGISFSNEVISRSIPRDHDSRDNDFECGSEGLNLISANFVSNECQVNIFDNMGSFFNDLTMEGNNSKIDGNVNNSIMVSNVNRFKSLDKDYKAMSK